MYHKIIAFNGVSNFFLGDYIFLIIKTINPDVWRLLFMPWKIGWIERIVDDYWNSRNVGPQFYDD